MEQRPDGSDHEEWPMTQGRGNADGGVKEKGEGGACEARQGLQTGPLDRE